MQLELPDVEVRLGFEDGCPMDEQQLFEFCQNNRVARIERDANGEIVALGALGYRTILMASEPWMVRPPVVLPISFPVLLAEVKPVF